MIQTEIDSLLNTITSYVNVNASFGNKDLGVDDYPHVHVIPNQSVTFGKIGGENQSGYFSVLITIKTAIQNDTDGAERQAIEILEKLLEKLPAHSGCYDRKFQGNATCEYLENLYQISLPYNLKFMTIGV